MTRWEQGRATVEQLVRAGRLQQVPANRDHAEALLDQAARYLVAARSLVDSQPDAGYVLAYDAVRKALTAVLENQGLRPTSSGGHVAVIDAVTAQLDPPLGATLRVGHRMRSRRNRVEYPTPGVPPVTPTELQETLPKVEAILDAAAKVLDTMPAWS